MVGVVVVVVLTAVVDPFTTTTFTLLGTDVQLPAANISVVHYVTSVVQCAAVANRAGAVTFCTSGSAQVGVKCSLGAPGAPPPATLTPTVTPGLQNLVWAAPPTAAAGSNSTSNSTTATCYTLTTAPCATSDNGKMYLHPTNCSRFLQCSVGTVYDMPCGIGTNFFLSLQGCGFPGSLPEPCSC
ncbi:uncharacterized protein [Procambarus clarkii]|uniref:uncharacterized protein isoform X1 n=1 Tax=Procambarus clarkii TaxID=6728 RepID=UPI00374283E9